ncbi:hypothetical protein EV143_104399 [Flavobacterium chryseum]|uniref:hypothetical protein n=1 Tax=Flavobacterium sp. P3160 TaxID=2512113 RepID=UPI0010600142|nr:hypothetical protein [Flavobacterium sp. P3160]TDO77632.1 hypothetical protein EV143_104399 [Flavobacterium sp. P3160]
MEVKLNQTYRTPEGRILRVKTVRDSGVHTLQQIDENGNIIPDVKNSFGHVIDRSERFCSDETIAKFKKIK